MKKYVIRKSWIDGNSEFASTTDYDLAVSICKPGYSIFDENGTLLYTLVKTNRFKQGDKWNDLKKKIEEELLRLDMRKFPLITRKEFYNIMYLMFDLLKMMNQVEIEDDKNAKEAENE